MKYSVSSSGEKRFLTFLWFGCIIAIFKTRMHSSRMCTAHSLPYWGYQGVSPGKRLPGQRISWTETPLWTETPMDRDLPTDTPLTETTLDRDSTPLPPWTDSRQTPVKISPCPELCLRAVIKDTKKLPTSLLHFALIGC